jgi:hypothetical protein
MRTDKYMMAKAWMKQDQAPQSEALDTWNTLEAEFNEERKAMLMASAESDKIKNMMNKKYGSGTMKYGSEISQPTTKPDVIEIDAINEFIKRNPRAEGGRMRFYDGLSADKAKKKIKLKEPNTLTGFAGDRKLTKDQINALDPNYLGDFKGGNLERPKKVYKSGTSGSVLDDAIEIRNIIVKNKGNIFGLEELGEMAEIFGEGSRKSGKGNRPDIRRVRAALEVAKDNFPEIGNFKFVTDRYNIDGSQRKQLNMVVDTIKNYQNSKGNDKLANFLPENMGMLYKKTIEKGPKKLPANPEKGLYIKMYNFGPEQIKYITDRITDETGQVFKADDYKNLIKEVRTYRNAISSDAGQLKRAAKMNEDIKKLYDDKGIQKLLTGDLNNKSKKEILERAVKIIGDDVAVASRRLFQMAQSIAGTRPIEGIIEDSNLGKKIIDTQRIIGKARNGYAFSSLVYDHYGKVIDKTLNSPKGKSFIGYYQQRIKNALDNGLVPDEIFSVTASARRGMSPYAIFTQALDADVNSSIKGANLDGLLSTTHRDLQEIFKGRKYTQLNTKDKKAVNDLVEIFENAKKDVLKNLKPKVKNTIQLAEFDLKNPPSKSIANYDSYDKNLQKAFDKTYKDVGYSMKVTADMKTQKELIALVGCPNFKGKQAFAEGGRTGFSEGGDCFDKGQKLINNGMKNASQASMRNFGKFANSALKLGRNVMKFGVIPEAMFIGAESLVRMGMGDTLSEASKQAVGFYLDPIFGTNFKKEGAFSKMERDVGTNMAFDVARLNEYKEALAKKESIESNKKNALAVNDESLTGLTDQEVAAQYDANIAKAQAELNKRMLSETERVDFENKADTAKDVAGVRSPFRQAIGKARSDTEMMRYENDFSGMQSDTFTQDPMSAKAKKDSLSNLLPQKGMTPRLSNFVNFDDRQIEQLSGLTKKSVKELRDYQDYLNKERALSLLNQEKIFGKEQTYGTQGNFFGEQIKQKPMYDYAEGGITGLRSKYEYKK